MEGKLTDFNFKDPLSVNYLKKTPLKEGVKTIFIIVPHIDDDVLSFGGLISYSIRKGYNVVVHVCTVGGPASNVEASIREKEFISAMEFLKVQNYSCSGYNMDGLLDTIPNCAITNLIDRFINWYKPTECYCGSQSEHSDHQALAKAFTASARLKSGYMPTLFAFGTYIFSDQLYSQPEGGKIFLNLTEEDYHNKVEAFKLYKSQFKPSPSPLGERGVELQSKYNGLMCGCEYAELYYQLRYIRNHE